MKTHRPDIANKTVALVENHSFLATLLAVLCLVFAINFFLTGPGSDGGSGLGGTGKFGGESGFGGTGNAPESGPGFKLGSNDVDNDSEAQYPSILILENTPLDALHTELDNGHVDANQIARLSQTPLPDFDVTVLRLSLDPLPAPVVETVEKDRFDTLVAGVNLDTPAAELIDNSMQEALAGQREVIVADTLITSLEILNNLILAESEAYLQIADAAVASNVMDSASDTNIRHRVAVPVRPERPDRFTRPTRITPVQRVDVPSPPPVRPMRTLSTLLNR